jgi:hypothetical protein
MKIEFNNHENELEMIESFLEKHSNPEASEIDDFMKRLNLIHQKLTSHLLESNQFDTKYIQRQKVMCDKLLHRLEDLKVQREIIDLAEESEMIANLSPETSKEENEKKIFLMRKKIDEFTKNHRPSRNNAKFIRFARACLDKAERGESVIISKKGVRPKKSISIESFRLKEPSMEEFEVSELLYELASLLYKEKFDEFEIFLAETFSKEYQNDIKFHVGKCGGDLTKLSDKTLRMKTIQGILGFSHELVDYYLGETPYPTLVEIHNLFQDLDFIEESETRE